MESLENHLIDKDGIPFTQLTISKPKIAVDKSHPFKSDFNSLIFSSSFALVKITGYPHPV